MELQKVLGRLLVLTLAEVVVAFTFGLAASYLLGLGLVESVIFAMAASIISTAIVGKIILERRMFSASESRTLVGLMIMAGPS